MARMAVLLVMGLVCVSDAADAPLTEAQIKKMKMKALRDWMADRDLECSDCSEKSDFQRFVIANREAKVIASKQPRKSTGEALDVQWKKIAKELCEEVGNDEKQCKALTAVVDGSFFQHGRTIAKKIHRDQKEIAKTSMGEPYFQAGAKIIRGCLRWQKKNEIASQSKIRSRIDEPIKKFLTAVAADNVNPMYDILKQKDEL